MQTLYYEMDIIPSHLSLIEPIDYNSTIILRALYETLFTVKEDGQLFFNGMKYAWNDERTKLTIQLNAEKRWNDGSCVKAQHYVQRFLLLLKQGREHPLYKFLCYIKNWDECIDDEIMADEIGVKSINEFTIVFELESPVPFFEELLSSIYTAPFKQKDVYNGPYVVQNITTDSIVLIRNKYYCYKKKNIIRKIVFKENYDYKQTIKNFFEGKCHITGNTQFPHEMISDLENNKDLVINNNSNLFFILRFNMDKETVDQVKTILNNHIYLASEKNNNYEFWKIGNIKNPLFRARLREVCKTEVKIHTNKKVIILYTEFYPNEKVAEILEGYLQEFFFVEKEKVLYETITRNEITLEDNDMLLEIISFECYSLLPRLLTLLPCVNEENVDEYIEELEMINSLDSLEPENQKCLNILENSREVFFLFELNSYQFISSNIEGFYIQNGQASYKGLKIK